MNLSAQSPDALSNQKIFGDSAYIAGLHGGKISKELLLSHPEIGLNTKKYPGYRIVSFKCTLVFSGEKNKQLRGDPIEYDIPNGGKFSPILIQNIEKLQEGGILFFEYIQCADENGSTFSVPPMKFVLK